MAQIAFLGLGAMGQRMAQRLLNAGHSLSVYNRSPMRAQPLIALGARGAATPKLAVQGAEFIFSMVTDDEAARDLWLTSKDNALSGITSGQIVLECSTITPSWAQELAAKVENKKASFLECPVAGSRPQADAGTLICFLGGRASVAEKVAPVLTAISEAAHLVGDVGSAAVFKLMVNGYYLSQIAALKEVMQLAQKYGLAMNQANEIFQTLPSVSPALKGVLQLVKNQDTEARFPIALVEKDLRYFLKLSAKLQSQDGVIQQTHEYFKKATDEGQGDLNASAIVN